MSLPATVLASIVNGEYDDHLDRLSQAIRDRKRAVAETTLYTLEVGQRVRLKGLRPAYLNGLTGMIVKLPRGNSKRFTVKLDTATQRFGQTVNPPAACVEAID